MQIRRELYQATFYAAQSRSLINLSINYGEQDHAVLTRKYSALKLKLRILSNSILLSVTVLASALAQVSTLSDIYQALRNLQIQTINTT